MCDIILLVLVFYLRGYAFYYEKAPASAAKKSKNSVKKPAKKNKSMAVNDDSYLQRHNIGGHSLQESLSTAGNTTTFASTG